MWWFSRCALEVVPVVALALSACGAPCKKIGAAKASLSSRQARAAEPHASVHVPLAAANEVIATALESERELPVTLPASMAWARFLDITVVPHRVVLGPSRPGFAHFSIDVEMRARGLRLLLFELEADVRPNITRGDDGTRLWFAISPEELAKLRPKPVPGSKAALAASLAKSLADKGLPRLAVARLAERYAGELLDRLGSDAFAHVRRSALARLPDLARVEVRLPDLPVENVELSSRRDPDILDLAIYTALPVRRGLDASAPAVVTDDVTVRVAGGTVAQLGNWAIDQGHLPREYTRELEPKPGGKYRPILEWRDDDPVRPLAVHVFQERGGCSQFRVGLRPELSVQGDELVAAAGDRKLEYVEGSRALKIGAWVKTAITRSIDHSRRAAAHTQVTVGGETLALRLTFAAISAHHLDFAFELSRAASARNAGQGSPRPSR